MDTPEILRRVFIDFQNSENEIYRAQHIYLKNTHPQLYTPVKKIKNQIQELADEIMNYYETEYGIDNRVKYRIILHPTQDNVTYTFSKKEDIKILELPITDELKQGLKYTLKKIDIENNRIKLLTRRATKAVIYLQPNLPLMDFYYILAHELAHVYTLGVIYRPYTPLQAVEKLSTSELLAVTLAYQYLDMLGLKYQYTMHTNILSKEYHTYTVDYLANKKQLTGFIKTIIESGFMTNTESLMRYGVPDTKISTIHRELANMTIIHGSFINEKYLEEVTSTNYLLIYYILNPEKIYEKFNKVMEHLTMQYELTKIKDPITGKETTLKEALTMMKQHILKLVDYNPDNNTIKEKLPLEYYLYGDYIKKKHFLLQP